MLRNSLSWFELLWSWGPLAAAMLLNALPALRKSRNPQLAVARKASAGCALWLLLAGAGLIGTMVLTGRIMLLTGPAAGGIAIAAAVRSIRIVATILAMLVAALAWTAGWIAYRIWFGRTY